MTDLSRNANIRFRYPNLLQMENWVLDNSAAQTVYQGAPLIIDQSADTLNLRIFDSSVTLAATDVFVGVANAKAVVLTTDTEADNVVEVIVGGEVGFISTVFTKADLGKTVYFDDSGTLTATSTANLNAGKLTQVEDGYAYVELAAPVVQSHI